MENDNSTGWYAIISIDVLRSEDLSPRQKLLFGLLTAMQRKEGYAYPTNKSLGEMLSTTSSTIQKDLKVLEDHGFIERDLEYNDKGEVTLRKIFVLMIPKTLPSRQAPPPLHSEATPHLQYGEYNSKKDNSKLIKTTSPDSSSQAFDGNDKIDFDWNELLALINKTTGRNFEVINESTRRSYRARLREKYTKKHIQLAIMNAVKVPYHKDNGYRYLTPEFFSRSKTLDRYGHPPAKIGMGSDDKTDSSSYDHDKILKKMNERRTGEIQD